MSEEQIKNVTASADEANNKLSESEAEAIAGGTARQALDDVFGGVKGVLGDIKQGINKAKQDL